MMVATRAWRPAPPKQWRLPTHASSGMVVTVVEFFPFHCTTFLPGSRCRSRSCKVRVAGADLEVDEREKNRAPVCSETYLP